MGGLRRKHPSTNGMVSGGPSSKSLVPSDSEKKVGEENEGSDGGKVTKRRNKKEKCRILAKIWDPQIGGCCFVPGKAERCCAIPLQIGTQVNTVVVCISVIAFQVFYCLAFATVEYYYAQNNGVGNLYCGVASSSYGYDMCLGLWVARLVMDLIAIIFCIIGFISAPCEKINPNMLETRHCQATAFFFGLCITVVAHVASMVISFFLWGSGIAQRCASDLNGTAAAPWPEVFCESSGDVQALLTLTQIFFIAYLLYVMLITLAYRGWLIVLHMRHFKGFKGGDLPDVEEDEIEEPKPAATAKVAPMQDNMEDDFQKALDDMMQNDEEGELEEITAKDNADDGWIEAEDEHGNKYYTNYLTGESAWSLPTAHLEEVKGLFDDVIDQGEDRDETIETVYKRFRTGEGKDGLIDYAEFCKVLQVDANDQVRKLFDLFDEDSSGKLTIKEFVVGVCNFTGKDTQKKVEFAFKVFDEDNDGVIDVEELCQILRAIHMAHDEKEVQRKAKLIMAKSDTNKDGVMDFDEFIAISKKFPNILFPAFNLSNQLGQKLGFT